MLCVHGFCGMGYNPEFVEKMSLIVEQIRNYDIDFLIKVVAQVDDLCSTCSHKCETTCTAGKDSNDHVLSMDTKVISHLGLVKGRSYKKSFLVKLTAEKVNPNDLDLLCSGCSWLKYDVCKKGIANLKIQ